jgi:hypothetical protein
MLCCYVGYAQYHYTIICCPYYPECCPILSASSHSLATSSHLMISLLQTLGLKERFSRFIELLPFRSLQD